MILTGYYSLHRAYQRGLDEGTANEYRRLIGNSGAVAELAYRAQNLSQEWEKQGRMTNTYASIERQGSSPRSDPTAVPSIDDVVEELKQQYQKTTFHHPV